MTQGSLVGGCQHYDKGQEEIKVMILGRVVGR
jgi:hypothetical protein